jgi:histidinol-phosphate aminotransferase
MTFPIARTAILEKSLDREKLHHPKPRDSKLLWLDKNENLDPKLNALTGRILREIDPLETLAVYPDCAPLYIKLADYLNTPIDSLILSTGSDGVIRSAFEAFCDSGDVVLFPNPTYAMYEVYARMYGAEVIKVDYQKSECGPSLPSAVFINAIKLNRPKLICLPNPGSPTGTVFTPDEIVKIIQVGTESGALILLDEAYFPYYNETAISLVNRFSNLLIIRTFSKAWGMTGLRVGYGVGSREVTALLHKVRPNYETNSIGVAVAEKMLDFSAEMEASVQRLNVGRDFFLREMQSMGFKTFPAHASFLHVNFGNYAANVHLALEDKALYREDFGHPSLAGYSRFYSTKPELFSPLVDCIRTVVGKSPAS